MGGTWERQRGEGGREEGRSAEPLCAHKDKCVYCSEGGCRAER